MSPSIGDTISKSHAARNSTIEYVIKLIGKNQALIGLECIAPIDWNGCKFHQEEDWYNESELKEAATKEELKEAHIEAI